jgi:hypothetical protein
MTATVDFWLDPSCPLTRHTARWLVSIADDVPLRVRWRVMSLSVLNENRDDDPEDDPEGYLWIPARVAAAGASTAHDAALRASHHEGVDRVEAEIGTPVLTVTTPAASRAPSSARCCPPSRRSRRRCACGRRR